MREVPECLQRRYKAVDRLIKDLSTDLSYQSAYSEVGSPIAPSYDPGVKLMCKFWNILKEDPNCNLQHAVQQRLAQKSWSGVTPFGSRVTCYQMNQDDTPDSSNSRECQSPCNPNMAATACSYSGSCQRQASESQGSDEPRDLVEPLSQALGSMKEAATVKKKCTEKTSELQSVQQHLTVQISQLEEKERNEVKMLKEADDIWVKMENEYKEKLSASKKRQEELLKQQLQVETSANKWRKNKQELEDQLKKVSKCLQEIRIKHNQKQNELKTIETEISDLEKRIETNKKELANESKTLANKKDASAKRMEKLREETRKLQVEKVKKEKLKQEKDAQGNACVKEARDELAKVCRVLLKKKLENEDLRAEAKALVDEIDLLNSTYNQCGDTCKNKEQSIESEIKKCTTSIEKLKLKTSKEHASTDTQNLRSFCTECPKCIEEMCECEDEKCTDLAMTDCVCMATKHKFMNNVFDNMYSVLERQINAKSGTAVAEQVIECLRKSRNGKLDSNARESLQNFILGAVKQNLNLTIIGGAVKTRCEMDAESYKKLMLCLTRAEAEKPVMAEKGTDSRKEPCARWGGSDECNCPKGPYSCICTKDAPCTRVEDENDDLSETPVCEQGKKSPRCPSYGIIPESYTSRPSKDNDKKSCAVGGCFNKNMRAAQCSMGSDYKGMKAKDKTLTPVIVIPSDYMPVKEEPCSCARGPNKCNCNEKFNKFKQPKSKPMRKKTIIPIEGNLRKLLEKENKELNIKMLGQNGVQAELNAELKKTPSGHMSIDVKDVAHIGEICNKKCPVTLINTCSGYKLIFSENKDDCNAVLTSDSTGDMKVVVRQDAKYQDNITTSSKARTTLFRVRTKNIDAANTEITLLKHISRGNYAFILEKEFEAECKKAINDNLSDNTYCYVNLSRTPSGTYVIDFGENNDDLDNNHNALLEKSDSGSVIVIECADVKAIQKQHPSVEIYSEKFKKLYKELSDLEPFQRGSSFKKQNSDTTTRNDLQFDSDIFIRFQDKKQFVAELSVGLKHVSSGIYSVIFNTKSEGLFVANMLISRAGWLPIYNATKHRVSVDLNPCMTRSTLYGWLKLSAEGEILVQVEETANCVQSNISTQGCPGLHTEKSVTTTCHGNTDYCDCDKTKCVCGELPLDWSDWFYDLSTRNVQIKKSKTKISRRKKSGVRKGSYNQFR